VRCVCLGFSCLTEHADGAIYFCSKYERTVYRQLQAKHREVCNAEAIERLFNPIGAIDRHDLGVSY
jgi:hypothetical protein